MWDVTTGAKIEDPAAPGSGQRYDTDTSMDEILDQAADRDASTRIGTAAFSPDGRIVAQGSGREIELLDNLRYAAKDAGDLLAAYQALPGANSRGAVHVLSITNDKATRDEIRHARQWLMQAKTGDLAVVFAAGHGMTDTHSSYYFGTHDIDPDDPSARGLPYEDFEGLLDGIAPLQKMLLLDTCFSGEIDKDDPVIVAQTAAGDAGTVKMRSFKAQRGITVTADEHAGSGTQLSSSSVRFQQEWFADLRRGTGAAVISSASGNEYALEGEQWNNGVFTYALLQGLKNRLADGNQDGTITVSELQAYVIEQVRTLTRGGQNPTVRRENLEQRDHVGRNVVRFLFGKRCREHLPRLPAATDCAINIPKRDTLGLAARTRLQRFVLRKRAGEIALEHHQISEVVARECKIRIEFQHATQDFLRLGVAAAEHFGRRRRRIDNERQRIEFTRLAVLDARLVEPAAPLEHDRILKMRIGVVGVELQRTPELSFRFQPIPLVFERILHCQRAAVHRSIECLRPQDAAVARAHHACVHL
jgi:hypothetical protein